MKIEHLAIWVKNLEAMKGFYVQYFEGTSNDRYYNAEKNFSSFFVSFDSGSRLELMHRPDIASRLSFDEMEGLTHFAMSVGSKERVEELTELLRSAGYKVIGEARTTGDGYYESVVLDPESNRIEITE